MTQQIAPHFQEHEAVPAAPADIDLAEMFGALLESKWLIAAVTFVAVLLGGAYLYVTTPVFEVDALLQIEDKQSGVSGLAEMSALFSGETPVTAEVEILSSRLVLGDAVSRLRLDIAASPRYFPVIGRAMARRHDPTQGIADALFGLRSFGWGGELIQVDTLDVPKDYEGEDLALIAGENGGFTLENPSGNALLDGRVGETATRDLGNGFTVKIFVSRLVAAPGTEFILRKSSRLQAIQRLRDALVAAEQGKQSGVIRVTLDGTQPIAITSTLNEIVNIYLRQNVERKSKEAEQRLAFLEEQLPQVKEQLQAAEAVFNTYRLQHGSVDLPAETQSLLQRVVATEQEISQLRQKRDELLQRFTAAHPTVAAVDAQLSRLSGQLARLNDQVKVLPDTQQEILRLSRDVEVNTALYNALLNGAQELKVAKAGTVGNVRVVDYALPPDAPVRPQKGLIMLVALAFGLVFGVVAAIVRRAIQSRAVHDPKVVEQTFGMPVYATVPHSATQEKLAKRQGRAAGENLILAALESDDLSVESLRSLRTSLHFMLLEAPNNVIMITGPSPGIGKSFVSMNLAAVLASAGRRVVVVDADMRKGHLNRYVGLPRDGGLSEVISGQAALTESIHRTPVEGLDLIPTGALPPNPAELLMHPRFGDVLSELSASYDLVLVDCPPIMAVTDAALVGRHAGASLLVIKAGVHPIREVEQSIKRLQQAGVQVRGFIFNDLEVSRSRHYGYGRYAYQYSYKRSDAR